MPQPPWAVGLIRQGVSGSDTLDMHPSTFTLTDDHPLTQELDSLRAAVTRYQHEAHATSLKLQRHSLDTSHAIERVHALESENALLKEEVAILREVPDTTPHPASLQVQELTIAHRRLSDKLTLTEESLLTRTTELAHARSELLKSQYDTDGARELAAQARAQLEEAEFRQRELERKARAAEEERKLVDVVVHEYADLVRNLEGRARATSPTSTSTNGSTTAPLNNLSEGKHGMQRLLEEHNRETDRMEREAGGLRADILTLSSQLEAERKRAEHDRIHLADVLQQLEKYRIDDNAAAKMVSRYMKFSQSSTDALQKAMDNLKMRHAATAASLNAEIDHLRKSLASEHRQSTKLRDALDELTEDISREAFGRRREISLRLAFLGREENLAENLRRWIRRARESFHRAMSKQEPSQSLSVIEAIFDEIIADADVLLESLNGQPALDEDSLGSVARIVAAQNAVSMLTHELHMETDRRLELERRILSQNSLVLSQPLPSRVDSLPDTAAAPRKAVMAKQSASSKRYSSTHTNEESPTDTDIGGCDVHPAVTVHSSQPSETEESDFEVKVQADTSDEASSSLSLNASTSTNGIQAVPTFPCPSEPTENTEKQPAVTVAVDPANGLSPQSVTDTEALDIVSEPIQEVSTLAISSTAIHQPTSRLPVQSSSLPFAPDALGLSAPSTHPTITDADTPHMSSPRSNPTPLEELDVFSMPCDTNEISESAMIPTTLGNNVSLLIQQLTQVQSRYEQLQRGFRDCNLALRGMKDELAELPYTNETVLILQKAVERLDDYNEDARVELEIRITDEARITSGYQALLTIPGAMSDEVDEVRMLAEIQDFVEGTDRGVSKAMQLFSRKLDDLQHDIAAVKQALHEVSTSATEPLATPPRPSPSWSSWTAGLLSPSRPVSPAPLTFGSVMTSPRLRQSSFSHPRKASDEPRSSVPSPFASLGLRIPMPSHVSPPPTSPTPQRTTPRPRVSSAKYMLGLGARTSPFGVGKRPSMNHLVPSRSSSLVVAESEGDLDSDVE